MNLQQLRHLVALAELGSFSKAAERCYLTQPALSRSISQLEQELRVPVVDRVGRRNEITSFGQQVLQHARKILLEAQELHDQARQQALGRSGHFRVGLGSTPAALLTGPLLAYVATQAPQLSLSITHGAAAQQIEALLARELDAVVIGLSSITPAPDLHIERLARLASGFLCRAAHPLAQCQALDMAALGTWPLASTHLSEEQIRVLADTYGTQHPSAQTSVLRCEDIPALLHAVASSDVISFGVLAPAADMLAQGTLRLLDVHPALPPSVFCLVTLAGRSIPAAIAPAFDVIRQQMRRAARRRSFWQSASAAGQRPPKRSAEPA